ncbi:restriction endonuclease subunit S [Methylomonas sp. OY6]|uniref:Restriction endonuclease subunit S n=1 Tax=Methylomonas defluvii TaxID=3045149 RepID=A0ABU4UL47_9GAMM|nr:restriction endonuclease subunit S [Methylomonas sp. OY6]MDX8129567.1 restriction endonuclease subunit S [Methylomonas sp. OY6]
MPSLEEQNAIANYLDEKTAKIDQQIDLLSQKAKHYGELKQALINETVTRGQDKTVPMKDSGIEWIGEIPAHWDLKRIKDTTYVKGRIGWQGLRNEDFLDSGSYYCVTGTDLKQGEIDWSNCYYVDQERYKQDTNIQLKIDDILITKDGTIGKVAIVKDIPLPATLNSGVFVTRSLKNSYVTKFMYWVLHSFQFTAFIDLTKGGSTIQHLYQNVFNRFIFSYPSLLEQKAIADYLDEKTAQIDAIVETINSQIDNLKALRKTLINDVVTGKICIL